MFVVVEVESAEKYKHPNVVQILGKKISFPGIIKCSTTAKEKGRRMVISTQERERKKKSYSR